MRPQILEVIGKGGRWQRWRQVGVSTARSTEGVLHLQPSSFIPPLLSPNFDVGTFAVPILQMRKAKLVEMIYL